MRTAQNTHAVPRRKEQQGRAGLSVALGIGLAALLGGCRAPGSGSGAAFPPLHPVEIAGRPADLLRRGDASLRRQAVQRLRDVATEADLPILLDALDDPDVDVAADAALALGVCGVRGAPGRLVAALGPDARPEVVQAAALGLGAQPGDDAERGLLALARRPERPAVVPAALMSHYRWRGRPAPATLGEPALLDYATHAEPAGRAGFGHVARAVKDPVLVPSLLALTEDEDAEVRRAATIGLAPSAEHPWPGPDVDRIVAALRARLDDPDARVVVAACRALSGFDRDDAVAGLRAALGHVDFHVRVAAIEGLVRREVKAAAGDIARLATGGDGSASVRGAAAAAVATLDPERAAAIADAVLADRDPFVRASGCDLLKAVEGDGAPAATARLIALSTDDPHVRVRETALGALEGRDGEAVAAAVRRALAEDADPVVVATACGVAAANGLDDLLPLVRAALGRFAGREGADAREAALGALGTFGRPQDAALLRAAVRDPSPSVAFAAQRALADRGGYDVPTPARAGVCGAEPGDLASVDGPVALVIETVGGELTVELDAAAAPRHVAHVVALAERGFYDGLTWHRVVPDFVVQGGCPRGDGAGSAGVSLPLEPTRIPFERGVLGMPRSTHPDSGGCQLFLMHSRAPHLDVHYTAFGRVVAGDEILDGIDVDARIVSVRAVRGAR